jgi:hypothetical protein
MACRFGTSMFERLRCNAGLRVFLAAASIVWFVSADACALSDVMLDCPYGAQQHLADDAHHSSEPSDGTQVGHCPHAPTVQLVVAYQFEAPMSFTDGGDSISPDLLAFLSVNPPPPTPPPI